MHLNTASRIDLIENPSFHEILFKHSFQETIEKNSELNSQVSELLRFIDFTETFLVLIKFIINCLFFHISKSEIQHSRRRKRRKKRDSRKRKTDKFHINS